MHASLFYWSFKILQKIMQITYLTFISWNSLKIFQHGEPFTCKLPIKFCHCSISTILVMVIKKVNQNFKGIFRDPLIQSTLFSTHLILLHIQKELSLYTNLTSIGFLQKQPSFDKIGRSLHFWIRNYSAVFNGEVQFTLSHISHQRKIVA